MTSDRLISIHKHTEQYILTILFIFHEIFTNIFLNLQQVVAAINAGVNPKGNTSNQVSHWDLGSSFFFAGTVITTIGRTQFIIIIF